LIVGEVCLDKCLDIWYIYSGGGKMIETLQLRKEVKCSQEQLARLIGVSVKTISRWEQEESRPSLLARQRIVEIQRVLQKAKELFKPGKAGEWLRTPNEILDGRTPLEELTQGSEGINRVLNLLNKLEWGIPA
jgi:putative toxin-antitoxin system antitoxin component (TIGR02293 family)